MVVMVRFGGCGETYCVELDQTGHSELPRAESGQGMIMITYSMCFFYPFR